MKGRPIKHWLTCNNKKYFKTSVILIGQSFEAQNILVHFNVSKFYGTFKCNICMWMRGTLLQFINLSKIYYVLNSVLR